jgi:hypothetical protein
MIRISPIFLLILLGSSVCGADGIFLKDGRVIQSEAVWEEGGQVKYRRSGAVVGVSKDVVDRIEREGNAEKVDNNAVKFDIWPLGIHIRQAMDIAEMNNIPLHRAGLISANKGFNPVMSRKYMDTDSKFTYKTHLMGYPAEVALLFSPISRRLAHVEIGVHPRLQEEQKAAYHELMEVLSTKYGEPTRLIEKGKIAEKTFLRAAELADTFLWAAGDDASIRLEKILWTLKITYMHNHWSNRMLVERKQVADQKTGRNNMTWETAKF